MNHILSGLVLAGVMLLGLNGCNPETTETSEPESDQPAETTPDGNQAEVPQPVAPPQADPDSGTDAEAADTPQSAIKSMVRLLRSGQYAVFMDEFRSQVSGEQKTDAVKNFEDNPQSVEMLVGRLEAISKLEPEVDEDAGTAEIRFPDASAVEKGPVGVKLQKMDGRWGQLDFIFQGSGRESIGS